MLARECRLDECNNRFMPEAPNQRYCCHEHFKKAETKRKVHWKKSKYIRKCAVSKRKDLGDMFYVLLSLLGEVSAREIYSYIISHKLLGSQLGMRSARTISYYLTRTPNTVCENNTWRWEDPDMPFTPKQEKIYNNILGLLHLEHPSPGEQIQVGGEK